MQYICNFEVSLEKGKIRGMTGKVQVALFLDKATKYFIKQKYFFKIAEMSK